MIEVHVVPAGGAGAGDVDLFQQLLGGIHPHLQVVVGLDRLGHRVDRKAYVLQQSGDLRVVARNAEQTSVPPLTSARCTSGPMASCTH